MHNDRWSEILLSSLSKSPGSESIHCHSLSTPGASTSSEGRVAFPDLHPLPCLAILPTRFIFLYWLTFFSLCWLGEVKANKWMKGPRASGRSPHLYSLSSHDHSGIRGFCKRPLQSLDHLDFSLHSCNLFCWFWKRLGFVCLEQNLRKCTDTICFKHPTWMHFRRQR